MRSGFGFWLVLAVLLASGCATAVDMDTLNSRVDDNTRRIEALERAQEQTAMASGPGQRLESLEREVQALRKQMADNQWTLSEMNEKVESFQAFMGEVQQFMIQYRKRGGEVDKALEQITARLEADIRSLADKLRQMLDSESGN
jgi:predicted  nucleic acid-binding Zn-ribbon protein